MRLQTHTLSQRDLDFFEKRAYLVNNTSKSYYFLVMKNVLLLSFLILPNLCSSQKAKPSISIKMKDKVLMQLEPIFFELKLCNIEENYIPSDCNVIVKNSTRSNFCFFNFKI